MIGNSGTGVFTQTNGNVTNTLLSVGVNSSGKGTYWFSSGTLETENTRIGYSGAGTFNQSGGRSFFSVDLTLGSNSGSAGTYSLIGGTLQVYRNTRIGEAGNGTFDHRGGIYGAGTTLLHHIFSLGESTSGAGTYLLSGTGQLYIFGTEIIGNSGKGVFKQSGGLNSLGTNISFSSIATLSIGATLGGRGTYSLDGGTFNLHGNARIGDAGTGTFAHSGGAFNVGTISALMTLGLGESTSGTGTYLLSGNGSLNVLGTVAVGRNGTGIFSQSGGTLTLGAVGAISTLSIGQALGSNGTYTLNEGRLSIHGHFRVGDGGSGTFDHRGGVIDFSPSFISMVIGETGNGTYRLSETVVVNPIGMAIGRFGTGVFDQTGGINTISLPDRVGVITLGEMGSGKGTYLLKGGTLNFTGLANPLSAVRVGDAGAGTIDQSGGTANFGSAAASRRLVIADENTSTGTYLLNGNALLNTYGGIRVGHNGAGTFNQSGGINNVGFSTDTGGSLSLGTNPGSAGNYLLSGTSELNVMRRVTVGGSGVGTFNQSGGKHTIDGTLTIAANPGSSGTYLFSGGSLSATGVINNHTFFQSGGSATFGNFDSGTAPAGNGTFSVSGGTLTASRIRQSSVSLSNTGRIFVSPKPSPNTTSATNVIKSLAITDDARLDLSNNSMIIDYSMIDTLLTDVRQHLQSGRLYSSSADVTHGLGYVDNAVRGLTSFAGQNGLTGTELLIKYTWYGDANLDGIVNVLDMYNIASSWLSPGTWFNGDFNYDGFIDASDLGLVGINWLAGMNAPLAEMFPQVFADIEIPAVPEPAMAILPLVALGLRRRRRS